MTRTSIAASWSTVLLITLWVVPGCDDGDQPPRDADVVDADAFDADEDGGDGDVERDPNTPCVAFPSRYPNDEPRPSPSDTACFVDCEADLACIFECPTGEAFLACAAHTTSICAWPMCRTHYVALDCCAADSCGSSALELSTQFQCINQNCGPELNAFVECAADQECIDVSFESCLSEPREISDTSPYGDCVSESDFPPRHFEGPLVWTWDYFYDCYVNQCDGDQGCAEASCTGWNDFKECYSDENVYCAYYTLCADLWNESYCCAMENCGGGENCDENGTCEFDAGCIDTNCRSYATSLLECAPEYCDLVAVERCTID